MIINMSGITIRMGMEELRIMGRATQGVRLIKLDDDDEIAAVAKIEVVEDEDIQGLTDEIDEDVIDLDQPEENAEEG
jgi:DNA gyrase subunit A